ncbi:MAG TPA: tetratricopeptide repeat protein [Gaiellaceae bacterium]|nr:tetratricopeptide repeat protein [Gaiellaceae bacterium]
MKLPSGTVTLLFTDIEGSTALAERAGERWPGLLAEHNRILREAFAAHDGIELGTEGDAFFVAFTSAGEAAAAAAAAQRGLATHAWPEGEAVRVRIGLHTGEPTPTPDGFVGLDMHRAARVAAAAHGEQVLLSQATRDLLSGELGGLSFRDLGDHRLKDLSGPQRLHQLCIEGLAADFPPLRTIEGRAMNLPAQPTPLVGRDRELAAVRKLLLEEGTRMLTLTGPGGTGKTRLALQAAADSVDEFPDGVYGVLLAPVSDPDLVPLELARVLGVEESSSLSVIEALKAHLGGRRVLILFDNFEHVGPAADLLADLLAACGRLKMLVTSREPLRIAAERQYPVPPLAESEAVMLFVERARALRPGFMLTEETAPVVAEICDRLDGLPLAIELAAAWTKVLPPAALLQRLENRLELPAARGRDVPARQSTLREAIAWSYDLLGKEERRLHSRLSVFMGGFGFEAAERVAGTDGEHDLLEEIASLVDRSLLREAEGVGGEARFSMLETIREFAREQLAKSGDEAELLRRHALEFAQFAEKANAGLRGDDQLIWFERLETEHDNLRAAIDSSLAAGDNETALRLGGALGWFWYAHGHALEGCTRLTELLAATEGAPEELRAGPLYALGVLLDQRGEPQQAAELVERSLAIFREQGDRERVGTALNSLGSIRRVLGDFDAARSLLEESLAIRRELGDQTRMASSLSNLGIVAFEQGDLDDAEARFVEALELDRAHGNEWGAGAALDNLSAVAIEREQYERAPELNREMLSLAERVGDQELIAFGLEKAAVLAAAAGDAARAGRLAGAADAVREAMGIDRSDFDRGWLDRHLSPVAGEEFEAGRIEGRALATGEALLEAMEQEPPRD